MGKSNRSTKTKDKRKAAIKLARRKEKSNPTLSPKKLTQSTITTTKSPSKQENTYDRPPDTENIYGKSPSPTSDSTSQST